MSCPDVAMFNSTRREDMSIDIPQLRIYIDTYRYIQTMLFTFYFLWFLYGLFDQFSTSIFSLQKYPDIDSFQIMNDWKSQSWSLRGIRFFILLNILLNEILI